MWFECDYLGQPVELTRERQSHIGRRHPNATVALIADAVRQPALVVQRPWLPDETLLIREVDDAGDGSHIVVAVVRDGPANGTTRSRFWVATAYIAATVPLGIVIWEQS